MPIQFDPTKKHILLPSGTEFTAQEIYNEAMAWADEQEAMDDDPPMLSTGYAPLGGGAYSDKIYILNNGWKIKPASGTYQLTILGTVITDDETSRIVLPDSGNVEVVRALLSAGADLNAKNKEGLTARARLSGPIAKAFEEAAAAREPTPKKPAP